MTNWYAVLRAPEHYRPQRSDLDELKAHFGSWHDPIPALLERLDPARILRHDLHYLAPALPSYVEGKVALLGDAAHAMTPDLGQGACQALIDGVALADCLADTSTGGSARLSAGGSAPRSADGTARRSTERAVEAGLRLYDRQRRRPTQRIAAMSRQAGRLSGMRHLLGVRDVVLKCALAAGPPA